MAVRSCRVTIRDRSGVDHTVVVTASTLYEAVALALAAVRTEEWAAEIAEGLNVAHVSATHVPVEHSVVMGDFKKWLDKEGGSPRERSDRYRVREILGLSHSRA